MMTSSISILLVRGHVTSEDHDVLSGALGRPVVGCIVADDGGDSACVDINALSEAERDTTSLALYALYRTVSMASDVDEPVAFARRQLKRLREASRAMDDAIRARDACEIVQASEFIRFEAENLAFALEAWATAQ